MTTPLDRLRKHHAVEHATIAVLHQRRGRIVGVMGLSDLSGFRLIGPFGPEEIESAANEALERLRAGERHLAITPFCGTNIAATGAFTASAALLAVGKDRRAGWPNAVAAAVLGTMVAARAGLWMQRYVSTDADVGEMHVRRVNENRPLGSSRHVKVYLAE